MTTEDFIRAMLQSNSHHQQTNTQLFALQCWHCWLGNRKGIRPVKK